jgi:hypothetical protein
LDIAKWYYKTLKPAVLNALYSKFQGVSRDEKFDKKLTGSPEFKILCIFGMPTLENLMHALSQGRYADINEANIQGKLDRTISETEIMSKEAVRYVGDYGLDERLLRAEIGVGAVAARTTPRAAASVPRESVRETALDRQLALDFLDPEPLQFRQAIAGPVRPLGGPDLSGRVAVASVPEVGSNVIGLEMDVE